MRQRFFYFDLGNVLVTFDHEIAVRQLAELASRPLAKIREAVFTSELQTRFETGLIDGPAFTQCINDEFGLQLEHAAVMNAISAIFEPNQAIMPAIELLQRNEVPMGILSNTCVAHWNWLQAQAWPMLNPTCFEQVILSYEVGGMKPEAKIYEVCETQASCRGSGVFFTDDRSENVEAAAERGWTTYQFGNPQELVKSIECWLADASAAGLL